MSRELQSKSKVDFGDLTSLVLYVFMLHLAAASKCSFLLAVLGLLQAPLLASCFGRVDLAVIRPYEESAVSFGEAWTSNDQPSAPVLPHTAGHPEAAGPVEHTTNCKVLVSNKCKSRRPVYVAVAYPHLWTIAGKNYTGMISQGWYEIRRDFQLELNTASLTLAYYFNHKAPGFGKGQAPVSGKKVVGEGPLKFCVSPEAFFIFQSHQGWVVTDKGATADSCANLGQGAHDQWGFFRPLTCSKKEPYIEFVHKSC